jgi:hypothetical protein
MDSPKQTVSLIPGDKVAGTEVYNHDGTHLGSVEDVMIDKISGKVAYAVMSFGGVFGIGEKYHPLPWSTLHYDTGKDGYVVNLSQEQLKGGPTFERTAAPDWQDRGYEEKLHKYYAAPPYWV